MMDGRTVDKEEVWMRMTDSLKRGMDGWIGDGDGRGVRGGRLQTEENGSSDWK